MANSFTLRDATPADRDAVYSLHESLFRSHIEKIWGWNDDWQRANFAEEWQASRIRCIYCEGELAGYLQVKREPEFLYVLSLGLIPSFQGRGIGHEVMTLLLEEAERIGLPLKLSVFRTNPRALAFYKAMGFRVTGETEAFYRLEWSPGLDGR